MPFIPSHAVLSFGSQRSAGLSVTVLSVTVLPIQSKSSPNLHPLGDGAVWQRDIAQRLGATVVARCGQARTWGVHSHKPIQLKLNRPHSKFTGEHKTSDRVRRGDGASLACFRGFTFRIQSTHLVSFRRPKNLLHGLRRSEFFFLPFCLLLKG